LQKAIRLASNLTSTVFSNYVAPKLETYLDKETVITHADFAEQIENRLGSGEGENAKGPDMKVWNKGKGLQDVCKIYATARKF
jgi:nucleosome binding factor SPN SPT16 subunit